jgi:hypothetical protein
MSPGLHILHEMALTWVRATYAITKQHIKLGSKHKHHGNPHPLAPRVLDQYKRHERQIADAYVEVYSIHMLATLIRLCSNNVIHNKKKSKCIQQRPARLCCLNFRSSCLQISQKIIWKHISKTVVNNPTIHYTVVKKNYIQ